MGMIVGGTSIGLQRQARLRIPFWTLNGYLSSVRTPNGCFMPNQVLRVNVDEKRVEVISRWRGIQLVP